MMQAADVSGLLVVLTLSCDGGVPSHSAENTENVERLFCVQDYLQRTTLKILTRFELLSAAA